MSIALIVDDNDLNLETLCVLLKQQGFVTHTLRTPADIVAEASTIEDLAIIFLDLEFPHHNGIDIASVIKAQPQLADIPLIAYTVHISEQNEARLAGFDGFIGKPLNIHAFPDQLNRMLKGEPVWEVGQ